MSMPAPTPRDTPAAHDWSAIRAQFPVLERTVHGKPLIYLDSANTGQKPQAVIDAVNEFTAHHNANVSRAVHTLGSEATEAYEGARGTLARFLNVRRDELVLCSGTTFALNLVAYSWALPRLKPGDAIVLTRMEHHANIVPWQLVAERTGATIKVAELTPEGALDLDGLWRLLTPEVKLLAFAHVSNVLGTVNPVREICREAAMRGITTVVDGSQAVPHRPVDIAALGCDFYAFTGHKMCGPTGTGGLWGRRELLAQMPPFLGGGEMIAQVELAHSSWAAAPAKFEAGTPPIGAAIGLGAACRWLGTLPWSEIAATETRLCQRLLDGLAATPGIRVLGPQSLQARAPVVSFALEGTHPHDICQIMDGAGVALRGGHHCAQPLHKRFDLAGTTRASLALYSDDSDIDAFFEGLARARRILL